MLLLTRQPHKKILASASTMPTRSSGLGAETVRMSQHNNLAGLVLIQLTHATPSSLCESSCCFHDDAALKHCSRGIISAMTQLGTSFQTLISVPL